MKKRMLLSLCTAVLSALLLLAAFPAAALAVETIVLTAGEPYITAIAGETVDLTRYAVTLNGATAAPESLVWKTADKPSPRSRRPARACTRLPPKAAALPPRFTSSPKTNPTPNMCFTPTTSRTRTR
ncbi:MAG: hypothetical protein ACLUFV_07440 [Acutalibacteraceae bacterium]